MVCNLRCRSLSRLRESSWLNTVYPSLVHSILLRKLWMLEYTRTNVCTTDRQADRQFIQTYTYSTSSQHNLYNEICLIQTVLDVPI